MLPDAKFSFRCLYYLFYRHERLVTIFSLTNYGVSRTHVSCRVDQENFPIVNPINWLKHKRLKMKKIYVRPCEILINFNQYFRLIRYVICYKKQIPFNRVIRKLVEKKPQLNFYSNYRPLMYFFT